MKKPLFSKWGKMPDFLSPKFQEGLLSSPWFLKFGIWNLGLSFKQVFYPLVYRTSLLLILVIASCEEQTDWNLHKENNNFIVVDGIITNEFKVQTLTLNKPVTAINEEPQPVSGAVVLVSSDLLTHTFIEDSLNPGTYRSEKPFLGLRNKTYSLLITSGTNVYSSKAELPAPVEKFNLPEYQKDESDNKYYFTKVPVPYFPVLPAMFEIQLDWSSAPGYETENPDLCTAKLYYYTLPTIDVSEVFAPGIEKVGFPSGTSITVRRYSLTDEHAAFMRALLLETTWSGGYFNTASANLPTNLSTGAIGFFGACGVAEQKETVK